MYILKVGKIRARIIAVYTRRDSVTGLRRRARQWRVANLACEVEGTLSSLSTQLEPLRTPKLRETVEIISSRSKRL